MFLKRTAMVSQNMGIINELGRNDVEDNILRPESREEG